MSEFHDAAEQETLIDSSVEPPDLAAAAHSGDADACEKALAAGQEINQRMTQTDLAHGMPTGGTALMWAAAGGHSDVCRLLLKHGADPSLYIEDCDNSALAIAAGHGHIEVCRVLLEHGASANFDNESGGTALIWAAQAGKSAVCALLLQHGADVNICERGTNCPALGFALHEGHTEVMRILLEHGASTNFLAESGHTFLIMAVAQENTEACRLLLDHGAETNWRHPEAGFTVLMFAASSGNMEVCNLLAEHGADLNVANERGSTALHYACRRNKLQVAKWLVDTMSSQAALQLNQDGDSALQIWGEDCDNEDSIDDEVENKEAFAAHVGALFADVL